MILAVWDAVAAAPVAFVSGLLIGVWIGARFDVRKKGDVE